MIVAEQEMKSSIEKSKKALKPKGAWSLTEFETKGDKRGELIALQSNIEVPFLIKRVYYMTNNRDDIVRGMHAHRKLDQLLIAVKGHVSVVCDDGFKRERFVLNNHRIGLRITDLVWREISDFSEDCVLLVLASELYDAADYIHDRDLFLKLVQTP